MPRSIWEILGIDATANVRDIKRAFAAKLRVTSPEADPAGYMALRDAFEAAKRQAEYAADEACDQIMPVGVEATRPEPAATLPPPSPQRQAFDELQALLDAQEYEAFLSKVAQIRDSELFATLDDQTTFIGEVALMVRQPGAQDAAWYGRLAAQLGAREHDNIFPEYSPYWFAYQDLLKSFSELRNSAVQAHADDRFSSSPGYLHVYHVLTSPFDSERLGALLRSRQYHAIAEGIFERAGSDPSIVIPAENRDWWERTAMAGHHRPEAREEIPMPQSETRKFPMWAIWITLVLFMQVARYCGTHSG
jgi:hypothetical protein